MEEWQTLLYFCLYKKNWQFNFSETSVFANGIIGFILAFFAAYVKGSVTHFYRIVFLNLAFCATMR